MSEQGNNISNPFMEVMTNKVQKLEEKIASVEQKLNVIPDNSTDILEVKKEVLDTKNLIKQMSFPIAEMQELSLNLREGVRLLRQPVENKVTHHHYLSKHIYISASLFLILCIVCLGWYNAVDKLDKYKENDTKYRFLNVQNNNSLRQLLNYTDSLYLYHTDMLKSVILMEDSVRERYRTLQKLEENKNEKAKLEKNLK